MAKLPLDTSATVIRSAVLPLTTLLLPKALEDIIVFKLMLCAMLDTCRALLPADPFLEPCVGDSAAFCGYLPVALPVGEALGVLLGVKAASVAAATAAAAAKGDLIPPGPTGCIGALPSKASGWLLRAGVIASGDLPCPLLARDSGGELPATLRCCCRAAAAAATTASMDCCVGRSCDSRPHVAVAVCADAAAAVAAAAEEEAMSKGSSSATASSCVAVALKAGMGAAAKGDCSFQGPVAAAGPLLPTELLVPLDALEAA